MTAEAGVRAPGVAASPGPEAPDQVRRGTTTREGRKYEYVERTVDGWRLRAYRLHQAAPGAARLAFVHGLEGNWDNWLALRRGCFEQFDLYALDLPWSGLEGYYWCHARPARDWLHLALELLPGPPAVLVAHSYGVNVVLEYLQRYSRPELAALVLISAFYRPDFSENDWRLFEGCMHGFRAILSQGILVRRGKPLEPGLLATMVEKVLDHVGPVGFTECFAHFVRTPNLDLRRVDVPALVLAGQLDPGAAPSGNAALAAALPAGALELFPHCGHFCMLEDPQRVADVVQRFLVQRRPDLAGRMIAAVETPGRRGPERAGEGDRS